MRKIKIEFPDARQIEINGAVFDVKMSDFEAIEMAIALQERLNGVLSSLSSSSSGSGLNADYKSVVGIIRETLDITDRILGKGATKKILGGRAADLNFMFTGVIEPILSAIIGESGKAYAGAIEKRYE